MSEQTQAFIGLATGSALGLLLALGAFKVEEWYDRRKADRLAVQRALADLSDRVRKLEQEQPTVLWQPENDHIGQGRCIVRPLPEHKPRKRK